MNLVLFYVLALDQLALCTVTAILATNFHILVQE